MTSHRACAFLLAVVVSWATTAVEAAPFVAALAGVAHLKEEGHAPPLCCAERERWGAPGARWGARLGYALGPVFSAVDVAAGVHRVVGRPGLDLTLFVPEAAWMLGLRTGRKVRFELALGAGLRSFRGTAHDDGFRHEVSRTDPDLRLSLGLHWRIRPRVTLGSELQLAKVMIEQHVTTLSFVAAWDLVRPR